MRLRGIANNFVERQPRIVDATTGSSEPARGFLPRNSSSGSGPTQSDGADSALDGQSSSAIAGNGPAVTPNSPEKNESSVPDGIQAIASAITYWIPSETIAIYVVIVSAIGTNGLKNETSCPLIGQDHFWDVDGWLWVFLILCAVSSPIIVYFLAKQAAVEKRRIFRLPWVDMLASMIAFVAWANYLPNSILSHCLHLTAIGGWGPLVVAQLILFTLGVATGRTPLAPDVTEAQRKGDITLANEGATSPYHVQNDDNVDGSVGPQIPVALSGSTNLAALMSPMKILPVFMGSEWSNRSAIRDECFDFLKSYIAGSTFQSLSCYGVRGTTVLPWLPMATPGASSSGCQELDLENALVQLIVGQNIQGNLGIVVFNPPGFNVQAADGRVTCQQSCGFHDAFQIDPHSNVWFPYSVIVYADDQCKACSTTRKFPDSIMSAIVHEVCEMVTNPIPSVLGGWITQESEPREIADDCQGPVDDGSVTTHRVQQVYIQGKGCMAPSLSQNS